MTILPDCPECGARRDLTERIGGQPQLYARLKGDILSYFYPFYAWKGDESFCPICDAREKGIYGRKYFLNEDGTVKFRDAVIYDNNPK